jgi:hypothetical protein
MSALIAEQQTKHLSAAEVGRLLSKLESMSEDDVQKFLAEREATPGSADRKE